MITQILTDTITGILTQIPMLIVIIWGVRIIAREMPKWLRILHDNNVKEIAMQKAMNMSK